MKNCSQIWTPKEEMAFGALTEGIPAIEYLKAMGINTSKIESNLDRVLEEIQSGQRNSHIDYDLRDAFHEATGGPGSDAYERTGDFLNLLDLAKMCSFNPETCQMDWDSYRQICREASRYHLEGRLQEYLASDRPKAICKKSFPWIAVAGLGALGFGVWLATKGR